MEPVTTSYFPGHNWESVEHGFPEGGDQHSVKGREGSGNLEVSFVSWGDSKCYRWKVEVRLLQCLKEKNFLRTTWEDVTLWYGLLIMY